MATIVLILFYLLFPVAAIYLARRNSICNKLGAVVICYIAGIVVGNIGLLPSNLSPVQNPLMLVTISLALPLMFFSIDVRRWSRLAGKSLLSFGLQTLAILIVATMGFFIFRGWVGAEAWKLSGMFVGVYTGGTVNLGAIATALRTDQTLYLAAHTSDVVVSTVYLLFLMTIGKSILLKFLPAFQPATSAAVEKDPDFDSYAGIFEKKIFVPLMAALGLSVLIFIIGGLSFLIWKEDIAFVVAILAISTLGIAFSFVGAVRNIRMTYQLGNYFILIFCLVVSSMADFNRLVSTAPIMLAYVTFTIFACLLLHVLLAKIFRIDADTVIITSVAGICSPPLVPMVAAALKNKEIMVSGVITGIIGWVVGTYLGITMAYLMRGLGF
ncbi:MAG: hypothetical protein CVU52_00705 [Deltaproteobacteria bacterium HGW-Deltaproteobacteria-10]|nr:MAG: hypothetical protein CVU52_00705 [Deltaproteobacteria bacterium HGW-Deltaproteobacteria-10]